MTSVAERTDALYGLPLDEFTRARNDLARELRRDGLRDEAAEVAALRKPSTAAWVVNRLARERRSDVAELVAAAKAVRKGEPGANRRFADAAEALARSGRDVLSDAGRKPSDVVLRDVATTLRTAAAEDPEALSAGRLLAPREAGGFAPMLGSATPPRRTTRRTAGKTTPPPPTVDPAALAEARRELTLAQSELRELRRRATTVERELDRLRAAVARAERRVERARAHLSDVRGRAGAR
jgi:hypothetical protein